MTFGLPAAESSHGRKNALGSHEESAEARERAESVIGSANPRGRSSSNPRPRSPVVRSPNRVMIRAYEG